MSAAASITHYASSPRTVYRAILRELRKSAPPSSSSTSATGSSLRATGAGSSSADVIASAQAQLAARSSAASAQAPQAGSRSLPSFLASPVLPFVRHALRSAPSEEEARSKARELAEVELFIRSKRIHSELLIRYNPTHGMTEQERVRATARRVGLDVPVEYDEGGGQPGAEASGSADASSSDGSSRRTGYTGPLPPPRFDD